MLKPGVAIRVKAGCTDKYPYGLGLDERNGVIDHVVDGTSALYAVRLFTKSNAYSEDGCFYISGADLIEIGVDDMYPEIAKYCENDVAGIKDAMLRDAINSTYGIGGHVPPTSCFEIKKVIYNDPATIVFWKDGTKTVVKACEDDEYDPEKGLAMAISKKALGNKGEYYETFKKFLPKEDNLDVSLEFTLHNDKLRECLLKFTWSNHE